jgi:hypothetical protein
MHRITPANTSQGNKMWKKVAFFWGNRCVDSSEIRQTIPLKQKHDTIPIKNP